ncbi:MAG: hypothetical protein HPAVJP_5890 [Candidatus Hepatoplasma vulgare]|nr:MAG: hypothetical protein HPAVJP_5890 [Candidatus Hepatoplasma sp.]
MILWWEIYCKKKVFVPQPDTEGLIDLVLKQFDKKCNVLEIGSGSGVIPIILAKYKNFEIDSLDINKKAIKLSKENYYIKLPKLKGKINFIYADFNKYFFSKEYDIIISNPPYLVKNDKEISSWVKRNQPKKALYSPKEELLIFKEIFELAKKIKKDEIYIFLEIGYNQKEKLGNLLKNYNFKKVDFFKDLSKKDRYLKIYV